MAARQSSGPVLKLDHLRVRYPEANSDTLAGLTLKLNPGE